MNKSVDVLIAGSGVSGLNCALNLRKDLNVLVICKDNINSTDTNLAQGGISVAKDTNDINLFIEDTLKAGKYKNNKDNVKILAKESRNSLNSLINMGLDLDKNCNGTLNYTREGAHSINRIVHTKDNTGENVENVLIKNIEKNKNITVWENTTLIDIIENNNVCFGAKVIKEDKQINVYAKSVVLATGGIGGLYRNSTNQRSLKGISLNISSKHNIELKDINYIQFHPTAFYEENLEKRRFLISESLRGEGALLTDINDKRFINELLPRDIVSDAIYKRIDLTDTPYVKLDISFKDSTYLKKRFSLIYSECLKRGTDITKEFIKVSPAQHFFMGGIKVDSDSSTSMKNLYAVGETSCTGVHGANRLASNSLLEGLVFSKKAAQKINLLIDTIKSKIINTGYITDSLNFLQSQNEENALNIIKRNGGRIDDKSLSYR